MTTDFEKRLKALEGKIKASDELPFWIDGRNNTVRGDVAGKRGKTVTFSNPYELRKWLEPKMDSHPAGGIIGYTCDCIIDLCEDAEKIREVVRKILPKPIKIPNLAVTPNGWVEKTGCTNHSLTIDIDHIPGTLALRHVPPGLKADIVTWCIGSLIYEVFYSPDFIKQYNLPDYSEAHNILFTVLMQIYIWHRVKRDGSIVWAKCVYDFLRLFCEVVELPLNEEMTTGERA